MEPTLDDLRKLRQEVMAGRGDSPASRRLVIALIDQAGIAMKLRDAARELAEASGAVEPLPLDPTPWRYDLMGGPLETRFREAQQETGGFVFAPRAGYEQKEERYS